MELEKLNIYMDAHRSYGVKCYLILDKYIDEFISDSLSRYSNKILERDDFSLYKSDLHRIIKENFQKFYSIRKVTESALVRVSNFNEYPHIFEAKLSGDYARIAKGVKASLHMVKKEQLLELTSMTHRIFFEERSKYHSSFFEE